MGDTSTIDAQSLRIEAAVDAVEAARAEVDKLTSSGASMEAIREAERALRHAKKILNFTRVGATQRSEHLEDTGAPPGSHEKKPPK